MFIGSNCSGVLAALATAAVLGGCSNFDTSGAWFSKPLDLLGRQAGYTYSNLDDAKQQERPITANDLVSANGVCPAPAPLTQPQTLSANGAESSSERADMVSMLGGGVAIGMSECDVVARLGQPTAVNLGKNPNGLRNAILTFNAGPRPGVYRFAAGRLAEMDRVEVPPPPPEPAKKKIAKKKPAKTKEPPKADDKT